MKTRARLRIAIQKSGRMAEPARRLLERAGFSFQADRGRLFHHGQESPLDLLLVRDDDIPRLIAEGACDLGVVGRDVLREQDPAIAEAAVELRALGFAACRLAIAVPAECEWNGVSSLQGSRIATSHPRVLGDWLRQQGIAAQVVTLSGSVEIAPRLGTADLVCDLVSTGATLAANALREVATVLDSEAVLAGAARAPNGDRGTLLATVLRRLDAAASGAAAAPTPGQPPITDWARLDDVARAALLARPPQLASAALRSQVRRIVARVRRDGDAALRAITLELDGVAPPSLEVPDEAFAAAEATLPEPLKQAIAAAQARIARFHRACRARPVSVQTAPGMRCERLVRPIRRVGLYIPAGSAPLPSTALMLGVPAQLAGCPEVVACTPPRSDGSADPAVLHAARRCGIARVFVAGGAQAIAAMAYGTGTVPRCDKLFGPGNGWVTAAKRAVSADPDGPAIDLPAGPSELLVVADDGADPEFLAADLLAQAEHGPDAQVLLVSDSRALLSRVQAALARQLAALPRRAVAGAALAHARLLAVRDIGQAMAIANRYSPEHLLLALREPRRWLPQVEAAGSVFLGDLTPEALGDYCSGTNHVLPTQGAARASSGVSLASFQTFITVQQADPAALRAIGPDAVTLARAERLEAHARSVALRLAALGA